MLEILEMEMLESLLPSRMRSCQSHLRHVPVPPIRIMFCHVLFVPVVSPDTVRTSNVFLLHELVGETPMVRTPVLGSSIPMLDPHVGIPDARLLRVMRFDRSYKTDVLHVLHVSDDCCEKKMRIRVRAGRFRAGYDSDLLLFSFAVVYSIHIHLPNLIQPTTVSVSVLYPT
jgi:hypothetical protein